MRVYLRQRYLFIGRLILVALLYLNLFNSMENTLQAALGKCLESAGTLRLPLVMPYRCIAPGEKDRETFLIKYNSNKAPPGKLYQHLYRQRVTYLVVAFFFPSTLSS